MKRRRKLPGERPVVLIRHVGIEKEERHSVLAVIQDRKGFFHLDAPVHVSDVVELADPRGGTRRLVVRDVDIYEVGSPGDHIEVSLSNYEQDAPGPAAVPRTTGAVSQAASGQTVFQAARDVVVHPPSASSLTRVQIGPRDWARLQQQCKTEDNECVCVPEESVIGMRLDGGWDEMTVPLSPGHVPDRLLVVDGQRVLGVPMSRALPWKGLSRTAQRMLVRAIKGSGALQHFQTAELELVRVPGARPVYGFRDIVASRALGELARRAYVKSTPRSQVLYFVTDEGRRVAEALLARRGDAWLNEPNPDCVEGWES